MAQSSKSSRYAGGGRPVSKDLTATDLKGFESQAVDSAVYRAGFFEGDELLFQKTGKSDSLTFTEDELIDLDGAIMTHNHPAGNSLSADDLYLGIRYNAAAIRATGKGPDGKTYEYELRSPTGSYPLEIKSRANFDAAYKRISDRVNRQFTQRIQRGELTIQQANFEFHHTVNTAFAREFGLSYTRS